MTTFADDKRLPFFHSHDGDKEYAQIVVNSLLICLVQATGRTSPGFLINNLCFGGDAGNKEKHKHLLEFQLQKNEINPRHLLFIENKRYPVKYNIDLMQ